MPGGNPPVNYNETSSGGVKVGGSAASSSSYHLGASGGLVLQGSAGFATYAVSSSGRLVLSGAATALRGTIAVGSGGFVLSGSAGIIAGAGFTMTGGPVLGGSATSTATYHATTSGGVALSGSAPVAAGQIGSGGFVLSGSATQSAAYAPARSGGVILSGTALPTVTFHAAPSGGLVMGGIGTVVYVAVPGLRYRVYGNLGAGGVMDFTAILAETRATSWASPPLGFGSDWSFVVRTYDATPDVEEKNVDARTRVVIDDSGQDVSGRPPSPTALTGRATKGGGIKLTWTQLRLPAIVSPEPEEFLVYCTPGSVVNYDAAPSATVPYIAGQAGFLASFDSLTDGTMYSFGVLAANSAGKSPIAATVTVVADATPPDEVDSLTIQAI